MLKLFELVGVIRVDGLEKAEKGIADLEKQVKKGLAPIERYGKQLEGIGKNLSMALTLPLALAGGAVLKFGGDFEAAMTNSLSIMGDVGAGMRSEMEAVALDLSETLPVSAAKAAEAYFFIASAGKTAAQAISLLPQVAKFATAGNFDMARATDLLMDSQSALGLSSKNVAKDQENLIRVSDVLVKANILSNGSTEQFAEALTNKAAAALRLLNKDVEEGVAVLAAYAEQGVKGEKAGEQLAIIIRDLQTAALDNATAFKNANIQVYDSAGKMNNLGDIVKMLETRLGGMSDSQKRSELTMLGFQDRSISAMLTLMGTSDAIKTYEAELRKAGGTTQSVSDKQMQGFNNQWQTIKNSIVNVAISFSTSLLPVLKQNVLPVIESVVSKVKGLVEWFNGLPVGVQNTVLGMTALVAVAGPALLIIGKLLTSVKLITTAFTAAKLAMVAFNSTLAVSPIALTVAGIVAMGIAVNELTKKLNTTKVVWGQVSAAMTDDKRARKELAAGIDVLMKKVSDATKTIKDEAALNTMFGAGIEDLVGKAKELGYTIEGSLSEKFEALTGVSAELNGAIDMTTGKVFKYTQATKDDTEATVTKTEKTLEQIEAEKKLREEKESFISNFQGRIEQAYLTEIELLDLEEQRAIESATRLGLSEAEKEEIRAFYEFKRIEAQSEADAQELEALNEKNKAIEEAEAEAESKRKAKEAEEIEASRKKWETIKSFAMSALSGIADIYSIYTNNKLLAIDQELAKEKEAIESSKLTEEEKQKKFEELDDKAAKKKKELQIKQAKANKAQAIADATMGAYQMAINGFNTKPFFPLGLLMGGIATALGLAKVAMIAATPLPQLAEGALIKASEGGTNVTVGEGGQDETVLPMRKGAFEIADRIMGHLSDTLFPVGNQPSLATGFGSMGSGGMGSRTVEHHYHFDGTIIADEPGLKKLERRLRKVRVSDETRRGE